VNDDVAELVPSYPNHSLWEITRTEKGRKRDKDFLLSYSLSPSSLQNKKESRKAPLDTFLDSLQSYSLFPHYYFPTIATLFCRETDIE
jgi:hypothetical protein